VRIVNGVDLVDISRLRLMIEESTALDIFLSMTWTPDELAHCALDPEKLATRWAAKEATLKALGLGIGPARLRDIEVVVDEFGPRLQLHSGVADRAELLNIEGWALSMTHEANLAIATVVGFSEGMT
jgi:holo-[acyl-carrier protein] synthase